jgi:hypothetical protein
MVVFALLVVLAAGAGWTVGGLVGVYVGVLLDVAWLHASDSTGFPFATYVIGAFIGFAGLPMLVGHFWRKWTEA